MNLKNSSYIDSNNELIRNFAGKITKNKAGIFDNELF